MADKSPPGRPTFAGLRPATAGESAKETKGSCRGLPPASRLGYFQHPPEPDLRALRARPGS